MFKTTPMGHQLQCLEKSKDKPYFAVFADMGAGKTKIAIDTFIQYFIGQEVTQLLVIAPKGNYLNWINELKIHCPLDFTVYTHKGYIYDYNDAKPGKVPIYLVNIEALTTDTGWKFVDKLVDKYTMIVIDESTKIKSPTIKRTKVAMKIGQRTQFKRILTGYPAPNNIIDLYSQFAFLHPGITQCSSWYAFRNTFCQLRQIQMGGNRPAFFKIIGTQNLDILQQRIEPYSFRIRKDECLDLPNKVYQKWEFELSAEQQKAYTELKRTAITELSREHVVSVTSAIGAILRFQQLTCGFMGTDSEDKYLFPTNPRLTALYDIVETLMAEGKKIIIWSHFIQCIKDLSDGLRKIYGNNEVVTYYGADSDASRVDSLDRFKRTEGEDSASIFIANPSVAGYGLTLTGAHTAIYYSNSYNLEHRLQSEDRIHRIGQQNKCLYIDICAKGTIDEKIITNLRNKKKLGDFLIGDEWKEWI